jgi:hypothetical protein
LKSLRGVSRVKRWFYVGILVAAAITLAVGGWIIQGLRAPFRAPRAVSEAA